MQTMKQKRAAPQDDGDGAPAKRSRGDKGNKNNSKKEKKKIQLPKLTREEDVPLVEDPPQVGGGVNTTNPRSYKKRLKDTWNIAFRTATNFKNNAPVFAFPDISLAELQALPNTESVRKKLEHICEVDLGPDQPSQCFSGQFIDRDGVPLLYYLSNSVPAQTGQAIKKDASEQYNNRTEADLKRMIAEGAQIKYDGIPPDLCEGYQGVVQQLSHFLKPQLSTSDARHQVEVLGDGSPPNAMKYNLEVGTGASYREDEDAAEGGIEKKMERAGCHHLVHGWIQQGQPNKGLFLSSEFTRSGSAGLAIRSYYKLSQPIAVVLDAYFKALQPDTHQVYRKAFKAGVWELADPGPWIGRAIVYKLQVELHRDSHDDGPTACFPVGQFTGGEMKIPQLKAKLRYAVGDVCLLLSGVLYHKVAKWKPFSMGPGENLTPGRISTVFFFPRESLKQLQDEEEGWNQNTCHGAFERFFTAEQLALPSIPEELRFLDTKE